MTEPDLRYNVDFFFGLYLDDIDEFKAVDSVQIIKHPDITQVTNFYHMFVRNDVRFQGLVFEKLVGATYPR